MAPERSAHADDPMPLQPLLERELLTGRWNGQRDSLAERGIEFQLALHNDVVSVVGGGLDRKTFYPGLVEPALGLDLGRLIGWENTIMFFRVLGMYGRDPAEATGSLNAPSNLANSVQTARLYEAWIERRFAEDRLSVLAGLYAVDNEFDVKETAGVFMNGGFGTGVDLSQSGINGPCIYPTSCLGTRLKYLPTRDSYVQVAMLNGVAGDPDDPYGTSFVFNNRKYGVFAIAEAGYHRGADQGRFLRAALGTWYYSAAFDDVNDVDEAGDPRRRRSSPGVYALVEGELYRERGQANRGLSGFARVGTADQDVHQVQYFASAGLASSGLIPGRGADVTAIGVSVPFNGSKYRAAQRDAGSPVDNHELALELTHHLQLLPWLGLQLGVQYIVDPGTDPAVDDALLLAMRCSVTL